MIATLCDFIERVSNASRDEIYDIVESECEDTVRNEIASYADNDSPEPWRSALYALGEMFEVDSLLDY